MDELETNLGYNVVLLSRIDTEKVIISMMPRLEADDSREIQILPVYGVKISIIFCNSKNNGRYGIYQSIIIVIRSIVFK